MERLSTHQFMVLGSAVLLGTTFFPAGSLVAGIAGRDGWMAILPGFIIGIPFGLMILSMVPKYPNKNLLEISERVLGKWLGKGLGILYFAVVTYFGAVLSVQGVDMFIRTILPLMPRYVFIFGGITIILLLFFTGIEVLARFAEVVFPIIMASLILTAIFAIPRFEQGELYPILSEGIKPIFYASFQIAPWPMEYILILAGLISFLPKQSRDLRQMKKALWRSVFLVVFLNTITVIIQILTFGPFEAARLTYGLLALGKMIEVSRTVSGVESVFALVWMGALIIKVGAFFFAGMWGIKTVFGLNNKKWSFALAGVYISIGLLFTRGAIIAVEIGAVDNYFVLPFTVFWVPLIWGVDKWKSRPKNR